MSGLDRAIYLWSASLAVVHSPAEPPDRRTPDEDSLWKVTSSLDRDGLRRLAVLGMNLPFPAASGEALSLYPAMALGNTTGEPQ